MTPGFHSLGARFFGNAARGGAAAAGTGAAVAGGFLSGLSTFLIGAVAAGAVISMIRQGEHRFSHGHKGEPLEGKSLEDLIAEKERIEDMIAELAARQGKG